MELISKDEAIVMLEDMEGQRDEDGYIRVYKSDVIANLRSLSSAEERKEGHWCYEHGYRTHCFTTGFYICSVCHRRVTRREGDKPTNFCPHCGAKMKGE